MSAHHRGAYDHVSPPRRLPGPEILSGAYKLPAVKKVI